MTGASEQLEMLDAVDAQDRVIGRHSRAEIHRLGLRHRAVHVLLYNSEGKLFLQRRALSKASAPGLWDSSCAGHVESGEDYLSCAYRELQEELGLAHTSPLQPGLKLHASAATEWEFVQLYSLVHDGPLQLCPVELMDGGWYSPSEIQHWCTHSPETLSGSFRKIWSMLNLY